MTLVEARAKSRRAGGLTFFWACPSCGVDHGSVQVYDLPQGADEIRKYRCRSCLKSYEVVLSFQARDYD